MRFGAINTKTPDWEAEVFCGRRAGGILSEGGLAVGEEHKILRHCEGRKAGWGPSL